MKYELIPPSDPRVLSAVAPFNKEIFDKEEKISVKEFAENKFETMKAYGGIGLSANQVGKPYRMFVMGNHISIANGKKWTCINPKILKYSKETILFKEGCLTFPFLFLPIERPKDILVEYYDENLEKVEEGFNGIVSRCFQHESDHMEGKVFTELVSKLKYDMAMKKRDKYIKNLAARVKDKIKDDKEE